MLAYPEIDPVAFSVGPFAIGNWNIGPLQVHWYGIMYLLGFLIAWRLALRNSQRPWSPLKRNQVEDLIVYGAWGVIIGGRLGYILFYNVESWLADPAMLVRIWEGGMSFHGGLLGVATAVWFFARKHKVPFLALADFVVPLAPAGLFFGRLGNFIGQELWGRPTDVPWAMIFPNDPEQLARHPSQLYEAFLEGLVIFVVVNWFARKPRLFGEVSGLFLVLYGVFRFSVEFVRQPDLHLAENQVLIEAFNWMTRGQLLCIPMILLGLWLMRKTVHRVTGKPAQGNAQ